MSRRIWNGVLGRKMDGLVVFVFRFRRSGRGIFLSVPGMFMDARRRRIGRRAFVFRQRLAWKNDAGGLWLVSSGFGVFR